MRSCAIHVERERLRRYLRRIVVARILLLYFSTILLLCDGFCVVVFFCFSSLALCVCVCWLCRNAVIPFVVLRNQNAKKSLANIS